MTGEETEIESFQNVLWKNQFTSRVISGRIPLGPPRVKGSSWYRRPASEEGVFTLGQSNFLQFICDVWAGTLKFSLKSESCLPWELLYYIRRPNTSYRLQEKEIRWHIFEMEFGELFTVGRKESTWTFVWTETISSQESGEPGSLPGSEWMSYRMPVFTVDNTKTNSIANDDFLLLPCGG